MAVSVFQPSLSSGELSPSLYGRIDLAKWRTGCSVARNMVVSYKGGQFSRGGTAFVGGCKQAASASSIPPRAIEFSFNIFQSYILEFGDRYMRVVANGAYVTETPLAITAITTADPLQVKIPGNTFGAGDWIFITGVGGTTQINGETFIVASSSAGVVTLLDIFGDIVEGSSFSAYTGGGTAARIFTLATPYNAVDLPYLKFTQSADVMSLTCVNQQTHTDYPPQELTRIAANNWTIGPPSFGSSIAAPNPAGSVPTPVWSSGPGPAAYGYVITAVDAVTGNESVASTITTALSSVDIAGQFGTVTVSWAAVPGAGSYNIYKAVPDYTNTGNFTGQLFGFVGNVTGGALHWQDTNVIPDFTTTPPLHINPFPSSGNYPGVVAYFQQRRAYSYTLNAPDTYKLSQPGSYTNFDSADPPIDSDSITGTPWASQVNGLQWMVPMVGGLIFGTGKDAWQLSGTGGAGSPVTPAQQNAQPQESVGFSATVPPIKIDYAFVYVQALGSIIREMNFNFYFNIYAGVDITVLSSHLFLGRQIVQWAWAKEPYKVVWCVRDDGKMLSLTYVKDQDIKGFCRHDTNGLFVSVTTASEPPVDAIYVIVKRYILGKRKWAYFMERMDNRIWLSVEQSWCVDAGLALPQPTPQATLSASRATLPGNLGTPIITLGGSGYTNPSGIISDPTGKNGSITFTVSGGIITGATCSGSGYTQPSVKISDATGRGAIIQLTLDQSVTFDASAGVFQPSDVGSVIRAGNGGVATISSYVSSTEVVAQLSAPITATMPNDPNNMPIPCAPGTWTMTKPVTVVTGAYHLEGMEVAILADGSVVPNQTVVNGSITLPTPASQVLLGLPFTPQLQGMHADLPGEMIQGKRKRIQGVTVRMANTRGIKIGQDQPIAATAPYQAETPWNQAPNLMTEIQDRRNTIGAGNAIPLFTGDFYVSVAGDYSTVDGQASPGMVAMQQDYPLPVEVLAFAPDLVLADQNG